MNKRYITNKGVKDKMWCDLNYPRPIYINRPTERMPKRDLQAMMQEHAAEARRIIDLLEGAANAGVDNETIRRYINVLHDFHNATGLMTALAAGSPQLWEE
jgi:hypothetical protein